MRALAAAGGACTVALLTVAVAGCPAVLSDDFHVDTGPAADASHSDAAPDAAIADATLGDSADVDGDVDAGSEGGPIADATLEADAPEPVACCGAVDDPLDQATLDGWTPEGVTKAFPAFIELTSEKVNQGAALLSPAPVPVGDFDVRFQFAITKTRDAGLPADGLAFVAMSNVSAQCDAGSQMCLLGTSSGFALVVRTYHFPSEPPAPYIALVDTSRSLTGDAGPPFLGGGTAVSFDGGIVTFVAASADDPPDASWDTLCLHAAGGLATVKLNGATILSGVTLPTLASAHWGFVAGTGGSDERHLVRDLEIVGTPVCGDAAACADAGVCGE
jgi:hypothetical protein